MLLFVFLVFDVLSYIALLSVFICRSLSEPLMTYSLHRDLMCAASKRYFGNYPALRLGFVCGVHVYLASFLNNPLGSRLTITLVFPSQSKSVPQNSL